MVSLCPAQIYPMEISRQCLDVVMADNVSLSATASSRQMDFLLLFQRFLKGVFRVFYSRWILWVVVQVCELWDKVCYLLNSLPYSSECFLGFSSSLRNVWLWPFVCTFTKSYMVNVSASAFDSFGQKVQYVSNSLGLIFALFFTCWAASLMFVLVYPPLCLDCYL